MRGEGRGKFVRPVVRRDEVEVIYVGGGEGGPEGIDAGIGDRSWW